MHARLFDARVPFAVLTISLLSLNCAYRAWQNPDQAVLLQSSIKVCTHACTHTLALVHTLKKLYGTKVLKLHDEPSDVELQRSSIAAAAESEELESAEIM